MIFDKKGNRTGGARLLAVVTLAPGEQGRKYRLPTEKDYKAVCKAVQRLGEVSATNLSNGLSLVPDERLPKARIKGNSGFRVLLYGIETFGDLFAARQKLALMFVGRSVARRLEDQVRLPLATATSRLSDYSSVQHLGLPVGSLFEAPLVVRPCLLCGTLRR